MAKKKMVILGCRDANGKTIDLKNYKEKTINLKANPLIVVRSFKAFLQDFKKEGDEGLVRLFEDVLQVAEVGVMHLKPEKGKQLKS